LTAPSACRRRRGRPLPPSLSPALAAAIQFSRRLDLRHAPEGRVAARRRALPMRTSIALKPPANYRRSQQSC
jgi:hypothetical protein